MAIPLVQGILDVLPFSSASRSKKAASAFSIEKEGFSSEVLPVSSGAKAGIA